MEYTKARLEDINKEICELTKRKKFLESKIFLLELWANTTIEPDLDIYGKPIFPKSKLFCLSPKYHHLKSENGLIKYIKDNAMHIKIVEKDGKLPEWRFEAYKHAKIYVKYFKYES